MSPYAFETRHGVSFLRCQPITSELSVMHAFSTRLGGDSDGLYASLNLGSGSGDARPRVQSNRERFARAVGFKADALVTLRQVHASHVVSLTAAEDPLSVKGTPGDGLLTDRPQLPLAVITADCFPVLLIAPTVPAIGVVHAGRRGTAAGIVQVAVRQLCNRFGARPESLYIAIGPGIGGCCYEVDEGSARTLRPQFPDQAGVIRPSRPGHVYLDLQQANLLQLRAAGVPSTHIWAANLCTACHPEWFYSWRREGAQTGRMLNVIMLDAH
jgi:YfiH family protein